MIAHRFPLLVLAWLLAACVGAGELSSRLDAVLAAVPSGGLAGVAVADCADGRMLYLRQADRPLALASTTKLLVSAAALRLLGTDYRFRTRIVALGPTVDGAVPGLGVIGGGDPSFDEHFHDGDPENAFAAFAQAVAKAGVRRIAGDLVIDGRLFSGPIRPATYPDDDENLQRWYSAPASAFAWADNCIEVRAHPAPGGGPCRIEVRPRSARIQVSSTARSGPGRLIIRRARDANRITVSGAANGVTAWFPLAIASEPDLLAGDELKHQLVRAGIVVDGTVRLGAVDPAAGPVLVDRSTPLAPVLKVMNQRSQNFYGEQVLRLLGARARGDGSLANGCAAAETALRGLVGAKAEPITVLDGSGLSHGNQASARAMVAVLLAMERDATFLASLKEEAKYDVAGAHGRVKTGTLAIATCLAGYVESGGRRLAFALLFNRGEAKGWGWAAALRERAYAAIAASLR